MIVAFGHDAYLYIPFLLINGKNLLMTHPPIDTKISGYYIGKKVPWSLLKKASGLGLPALTVYLGLWVLFSATRCREIEIRRDMFDDTGLAGSSISRGLKALIGAGLVNEIIREPGRTPIVELLTNQNEVYAKY